MLSSTIVPQAVDRASADMAHAELTSFLDSRNPGAVTKQLDKVLSLDVQLESLDLQKTSSLVADFLHSKGKRLAADFLQAQDATLERSFLVLYCA
ncbi:uncharacterized protein BP5553_10496 [Venustampulla echinocandica]|uniref:Uncharacterized protein n=1 Tax=Venustampulla echinocandica TaxID=2656787 RepID=A0A370T9H8_9HELO|nr:uncharacterized protein BP5553_10496 [Venustampulla echinocandica]RDL30218.1 hypothetical protein BP5553_10496 [Venustampulla echinocandica]